MTSGRSGVEGRRTRSSDMPVARNAATLCWQCSRVPTRAGAARAAAASSGSLSRRACASVSVRPGDAGRQTAARSANDPSRSMSSSRLAGPNTGVPPAAQIARAEETSWASAETSRGAGSAATAAAIACIDTAIAFPRIHTAAPPGSGSLASSNTQPIRIPSAAASAGHGSPWGSHTASQPARAARTGIGGREGELRGARRPSSSGWAGAADIAAILTLTFRLRRRIGACLDRTSSAASSCG
jgi:hypothetical protein